MENRPALWRICRRLHNAHTHTPFVEELALELALESADYSYESSDSNADPVNISVWVRALNLNARTHTPIFGESVLESDSNADFSTDSSKVGVSVWV